MFESASAQRKIVVQSVINYLLNWTYSHVNVKHVCIHAHTKLWCVVVVAYEMLNHSPSHAGRLQCVHVDCRHIR
jgi:hypothetical protein